MVSRFQLDAPRRVLSANANFYQAPALHPERVMAEHDLVYLLRGGWPIEQAGLVHPVGPDQVILLHAGQRHGGSTPCLAGTRTLYLHISADPGDAFGPGPGAAIPTVVSCRDGGRVRALFEQAVQAFLSGGPARQARLSALCQLILCELHEQGARPEGRTGAADAAAAYLHAHPHRNVPVAELAQAAFVSERTLREQFRRRFGCTPHQYQTALKIRLVQVMLRDFPELPLREVAHSFGFCDEFHLSRVFKRQVGAPPSAWRP